MSMAPLMGIPGKLKLLLDRLTSALATKLDTNVDATISSRAPSSTSLSNATYTNARAANLDNLDASISGLQIGKFQSQLFTGSGTWTKPANLIGDILITASAGGGGGARSGATGAIGGDAGEFCIDFPTTPSGNIGITIGGAGGGKTGSTGSGAAGGNTVLATGVVMTLYGGPGGGTGVDRAAPYAGEYDGANLYSPTWGAKGITVDGTSRVGTSNGGARAGYGYGAGGAGAPYNININGGNGVQGVVLIKWWEKV